MNKEKRSRLSNANDLIKEAVSVISSVRDDEDDSFNNLSDGLQNTQRGMDMQDAVEQMDGIIDALEEVSSDLDVLSL